MKLNLFKLFGVDVKLHWSWFLLLLLYIDFGDTATEMMYSVLTLVTVFGYVLVHEFGHILAAKRYGVSTDYVVLNIFGGVAMVDQTMQDLTPKQQMWVVFAGPLTNLIMIFMLLPLGVMFANGNTSVENITGIEALVYIGLAANFLMFVFNLLPIYPMDGGRLLRSILEHMNVKGAQYYSIRVTQVFAVLLIIFSFWIGSFLMPIVAVLFFILSFRELTTLKQEIYGHEYDKIAHSLEDGHITYYEAQEKTHQLNLDYKGNDIFFKTDYVQKRVSYGSTEDSE
jgi:Zn-dependent protease